MSSYPLLFNQRTTNEKYGDFYEIAKTSLVASPRGGDGTTLRNTTHAGWEGRLADTANSEYGAATATNGSRHPGPSTGCPEGVHYHVRSEYIDRHPPSNEKVTIPFDLSYRQSAEKTAGEIQPWDPSKSAAPPDIPRNFPPPLPPLPPNKKQLSTARSTTSPTATPKGPPKPIIPPTQTPLRPAYQHPAHHSPAQVEQEESATQGHQLVPILSYGEHQVRLPDVRAIELHMRDESRVILDMDEMKKRYME